MKYVYANKMACEMTGYTVEELLKLGPADLDVSCTKELLALKFDAVLRDENKVGVLLSTHKKKDQSTFTVEMLLRAVEMDGRNFIISSKRNVTAPSQIEDRLKESEEEIRLLLNNIKDYAIYMVDPNGIIKTWNEGARNIKGYTAEEIIGRSMEVFYLKEDIDNNVVNIILELAKEKGSIEIEGWRVRKDGTLFWANVTLSAVYDKTQKLNGFAKITRDITEQKILRERLNHFNNELKEQVRLKTAELTGIFERITDAFIAIDVNWCYTYINTKAGEILNINPSEMIGKCIGDSHEGMYDLPIFKKYQEAMQEQKYITCDSYFPAMDRWFVNHIYPSPEGLSIFFSDITEKKKVQEALEKSELQYRTLIEHASDAIVITDQYGHYMEVNSSACRLLQYSKEELLSLSAVDILYDANVKETVVTRYETLKSGKPVMREATLKRKNGSLVEVESHSIMLPDGRFLGMLRDITERKKIQKRLIDSETRLREAQHLAGIGGWELDHITNQLEWSDEAFRIFDITYGQAPTFENAFKLIHPDDRLQVEKAFKESLETKTEFDSVYRIITKEGIRYVHGRGFTFYDDSGLPIRSIGTVQNITERKKAEESLRLSEARFKRIFDSNMVGFLFYNLNGQVTEANDRFLDLVGYTRLDLQDGKIRWKDLTPPEYEYLDRIAVEQIKATGISQPYDKEYFRKDGSRIPVAIGAASLTDNNYESGVAYILDISQRKQAEDEIKQSQMELRQLAAHLQTVREEERAAMAREIHDELGQQLTGLKMDLYWLNKQSKLSEDEKRKKIQGSIRLLDKTINVVRKLSSDLRPGMLDDLGLVEALEWYGQEFQTRSGITVKFSRHLQAIKVNPDVSIGLFRIYQESLTNVARHAGAQCVNSELEVVNDQIILTIVDNGKGFDKQKTSRKRTLGLLGMKERTLMMGGKYEITSEPGKGTKVLVTVPLSSAIK